MFRILHALYEMPPLLKRLGRLRGSGDHHFYHHRLGSEQAIINVHAGGSIAHDLGHPGIGQEDLANKNGCLSIKAKHENMMRKYEFFKSRVGVLG